ncbi:hypothetical protein P367_23210 [Comamonas thiooxydans]|nr:hypothetical protein P369_22670 [Comamonas thiooxydans]KGG94274.1 hypothetical protein P367_23210 [Comamonas thiooxydans]
MAPACRSERVETMGAQAFAHELHDPALALARHAVFGGGHADPCQHIAAGGLTESMS